MTDVKEWLSINYNSDEEIKKLTDLYLSNADLEGELELTWEKCPKLERVWYHHKLRVITNYDLKIAELTSREVPKGIFLKTENRVEVLKYVPFEERMKELYSDEVRDKITKLDLTQKGLRGTLDLSGFENLEELTVNMDFPWGRKYANSNYITGLNFEAPEKVTKLTLTNCPVEFKLEKLDNMTNLKTLVLKGHSDQYPAYWTGSLERLKNLEHLTEIDISYCPNIKQGLEDLKVVEKFECKGTDYEKKLKPFGGDVNAWKLIFYSKKVSEDNNEIIKKINENLIQTRQSLKELDRKQLTDTDLEKKVEILEERVLKIQTKE